MENSEKLIKDVQKPESHIGIYSRDKLKLFPPRAYGFPRTRESFNGKTGISFDPFSAASTASEMTLSLLLNPKRLNRIKIQNTLDNSKMSIRYVLNELISKGEEKLDKYNTKFEWKETLKFPFYLGGIFGEFFGTPILKLIWKKNLKNLKEIF